MNRNKSNNQFGVLVLPGSGYKKYWRLFITSLVVVIFVVGGALLIFGKFHKVKKAETVATPVGPIPSWWYQQYFTLNACAADAKPNTCQPGADPDNDGLTNAQEFYYHTNPLKAYTVGDKLNDGQLVAAGFDPSRTGHMTFDQVTAPDNILGDSLLVGQDFKDIIAQNNDISKVPLPLVTDDQLKVTQDTSQKVYDTYDSDLNNAIGKYFTQSDLDNIGTTLTTGTGSDVDQVRTKASLLATDLQSIEVPQKFLLYHKYILAFFQLLPKVLLSNGDPGLNTSSPESDIWFENAQALFAVTQKLSAQGQQLTQPTQITP